MIFTRTISARLLLCAFALGACSAVNAASVSTSADAKARYESDVARCKAGQTNQDEATCIREAGAALEEANRNRLTNNDSNYAQNQTDRCHKLPVNEQSDCLKQMSGADTQTQGSINAGGVLRETKIEVSPGTPGSTTTPGNTQSMPATPSSPSSSTMSPSAAPGTGTMK